MLLRKRRQGKFEKEPVAHSEIFFKCTFTVKPNDWIKNGCDTDEENLIKQS